MRALPPKKFQKIYFFIFWTWDDGVKIRPCHFLFYWQFPFLITSFFPHSAQKYFETNFLKVFFLGYVGQTFCVSTWPVRDSYARTNAPRRALTSLTCLNRHATNLLRITKSSFVGKNNKRDFAKHNCVMLKPRSRERKLKTIEILEDILQLRTI